jgi:hypothetical protein
VGNAVAEVLAAAPGSAAARGVLGGLPELQRLAAEHDPAGTDLADELEVLPGLLQGGGRGDTASRARAEPGSAAKELP